eukprot:scaffold119109_cov68-Phaeocystis_antarctica.AAC.10
MSSPSRCCGSIAAASAADTPKRSLSKPSAPHTKPACCTHAICASLSVATSTAVVKVHRAAGTTPTASAAAAASDQLFALLQPGQRPLIAASFSRPCATGAEELTARDGAGAGNSCWRTRLASARIVPVSSTATDGKDTPVASLSCSANDASKCESSPTSISGLSRSILSLPPTCSTTRALISCMSCSREGTSLHASSMAGWVCATAGTCCAPPLLRCTASRIGATHSGLRSAPRSPSGTSFSIARSSRRMYLPLYVSGRAGTTTKRAGTAIALWRACTSVRRRASSLRCSVMPGRRVRKAAGAVPSNGSSIPTTAQLSTGEPSDSLSSSSRFSISSVPMRLPATLMTSSLRPWKLKAPPACRTAASPCTVCHVWVLPANYHLTLLAVGRSSPAAALVLYHNISVDPWERPAPRVWVQRLVRVGVAAAPDNTAVLGCPVAVNVVGREVALREGLHDLVDGLSAERAHAQAGEVVACEPRFCVGRRHEHAQKGGARLEDSDAVARNYVRNTVGRRGWRAWRCDHVRLPCDPSRRRHHADEIRLGTEVEDEPHRGAQSDLVPSVCVHDALGLAGGARRVEHKQWPAALDGRRRNVLPRCREKLRIREALRICTVEHGSASASEQHMGCHAASRHAAAAAAAASRNVPLVTSTDAPVSASLRSKGFGHSAVCERRVELAVPAATATNGTPSRLAASIQATASGVLGMYLHGKARWWLSAGQIVPADVWARRCNEASLFLARPPPDPPAVQRDALRRGDAQPLAHRVRDEHRMQQQPAPRDVCRLATRRLGHKGHLSTIPTQHLPVDLVEGGVRLRAAEPSHVRSFGGVDSSLPWLPAVERGG